MPGVVALGKPVICYLREEDLKFIPSAMRADIPIINATPKTIYQVLKKLLTSRRNEMPILGQRSRSYVEKWHDPLRIAQSLAEEYHAVYEAKHRGSQAARQHG
jgi:hypothetical protein